MSDYQNMQFHPDELDYKNAFIEKLIILRGAKNLSSFAAFCGLSEGGMRKYITGISSPSLDKLAQIARANGVSISWLVGETTSRPPQLNPLLTVEKRYPSTEGQDALKAQFLGFGSVLTQAINSLSIEELQQLTDKVLKHGTASLLETPQQLPEGITSGIIRYAKLINDLPKEKQRKILESIMELGFE